MVEVRVKFENDVRALGAPPIVHADIAIPRSSHQPQCRTMSNPSQSSVTGADQKALAQSIPGAFEESDIPSSSSERSLSDALHQRRAEFTRPRQIRIKVASWNVAAKRGPEKDLAGWFIEGKGVAESLTGLSLDVAHGSEDAKNLSQRENVTHQEARFEKHTYTLPKHDHGSSVGEQDVQLWVLGLQEAASVDYKSVLEESLPAGSKLVSDQQLSGMWLLIYASPLLASEIRSVSCQSIGTGLMGYMGNKGATVTRMVIGESTRLVFVNCHLAAGIGKAELERRNWDASTILSRTRFAPVVDSLGAVTTATERIGDEDLAFWFGDLNYRLESIPGDDVRRLLMLHTRNEYDLDSRAGKPLQEKLRRIGDLDPSDSLDHGRDSDGDSVRSSSTAGRPSTQSSHTFASTDETVLDPNDDPASLQTTIASLLPHDELHQQMAARKMFHDGWQEGPITFLPTYKYDVGSVGIFDSSDKRRGPSWCDRILFRTRRRMLAYHRNVAEEEAAKKRDADLLAQGIDKAADDEDTLFEYNPDADADDDYKEDEAPPNHTGLPAETLETKEGFEDIIQLESYISHQRVLSSDHKPLTAQFAIKYDSVVPELKAKIHQEIVKELDRAENESRPSLTIVVENSAEDESVEQSVNFGPLRYEEAKTRSLTLANTGRVAARFGFLLRPVGLASNQAVAEEWLEVHIDKEADAARAKSKSSKQDLSQAMSEQYILEPGDTCNIDVTAKVRDKALIKRFNDEADAMEDVLVLRVLDGRDHFLPIKAEWQQSALCRTVDRLCRVPEGGVRALGRVKRKSNDLAHHIDEDPPTRSGPRELFKLTEKCESMVERILAEETMLMQNQTPGDRPWIKYPGWPFIPESWQSEASERQALCFHAREALDLDEEFDDHLPLGASNPSRLEAVAATLIDFLEGLEDGIITKGLWIEVDNEFLSHRQGQTGMDVDDERAKVLEILAVSRAHSVSFVFLTSMMAHGQ